MAEQKNSDAPSAAPAAKSETEHKPFEPVCIDLTPDEAINVGFVGGIRIPKK